MPESYQLSFVVRWGDVDFNGHMKNVAYLDFAAHVRMCYFDKNGFSIRDFERLRFGPVVFKDEIHYFREMRMLDHFSVNLQLGSLNEDGSRFVLFNTFYREDGERAATVMTTGGWLDLDKRKLTLPPEPLFRLLANLEPNEVHRERA